MPNLNALSEIRIAQNRFGYRMWEGIINPEDRPETIKEGRETLEAFEKAYKNYQDAKFTAEKQRCTKLQTVFPAVCFFGA